MIIFYNREAIQTSNLAMSCITQPPSIFRVMLKYLTGELAQSMFANVLKTLLLKEKKAPTDVGEG